MLNNMAWKLSTSPHICMHTTLKSYKSQNCEKNTVISPAILSRNSRVKLQGQDENNFLSALNTCLRCYHEHAECLPFTLTLAECSSFTLTLAECLPFTLTLAECSSFTLALAVRRQLHMHNGMVWCHPLRQQWWIMCIFYRKYHFSLSRQIFKN